MPVVVGSLNRNARLRDPASQQSPLNYQVAWIGAHAPRTRGEPMHGCAVAHRTFSPAREVSQTTNEIQHARSLRPFGDAMAILWEHHIIPKKFKGHPAFRGLDEQLFDVEAPRNLIYLPADYELARKTGVSPHPGGHDFRFYEGVKVTLDLIAKEEEANRRATEIIKLIDAMRVGLVNGDLYTNVPLGGTGEELVRGVERVIADYDQYREKI